MHRDMTVSRDSVGSRSIILEGVLKKIASTPESNRIRYVKSLGVVDFVYTGAKGTRYAHCLGAVSLPSELVRRGVISEEEAMLLETALLIHDFPQGPFSHLSDKNCTVKHDELLEDMILGRLDVGKPGWGNIHNILVRAGINPEEIVSIVNWKHRKKHLCSLFSGYFDFDKMDYLPRDAQETGVKMGIIDTERILDVMEVCDNQLCIQEEGFDAAVDMIDARGRMYRRVYFHPKVAVYEAMLNLAIEKSSIEEKDLRWMDDCELLSTLSRDLGVSAQIVQMMKDRKIYSRLHRLTLRSNFNENLAIARHVAGQPNLVGRIAEYAGLRETDVLPVFKFPRGEKANGRHYFPLHLNNGDFCNIFEYDDNKDALHAIQRPDMSFYAMFAVHPAVASEEKAKVEDFVQSLYTQARKEV